MLDSAASSSLRAGLGFGQDAPVSIKDGGLYVWRERSQARQDRELEHALANFAFIADVTTLASDCRFAGNAETLVACYDGLPFTAIAFHTQDRRRNREDISRRMTTLTRRLIAPDETFHRLVSEQQWWVVESAFHFEGQSSSDLLL